MPKEMLSMVCERNLEEGWLEVVRPRQPTPLANTQWGGGGASERSRAYRGTVALGGGRRVRRRRDDVRREERRRL